MEKTPSSQTDVTSYGLLKRLAQRAVTPSRDTQKMQKFCDLFNAEVAPTLKKAGLKTPFYARMTTTGDCESICKISAVQKGGLSDIVTSYDSDMLQMDGSLALDKIAERIINYINHVEPDDRGKIACNLPGLIQS